MFGSLGEVQADPLALATELAHASVMIGRLDQALASHPLRPAFLHRARLEAVRRQAAVDGKRIDPWHLAALIEGLRLRMDPYQTIVERGEIFEAGRLAFGLYQWLTTPDFDQEGAVHRAEQVISIAGGNATPLLAGAAGTYRWLNEGGDRPPIRAALVRFWVKSGLIRAPIPLTGAASLRSEADWNQQVWPRAFLQAIAAEAEDGLQQLMDLERAWFSARGKIRPRRRNSKAPMAVDIMAATPILSASSLSKGLGMAVQNATALLDEFCALGIAVEVTHRSKRRLFGLRHMAPIRDGVAAPRRPELGRGPGRPAVIREDEELTEPPPLPLLTPIERRTFDYSDLEYWMRHLDAVMRAVRVNLNLGAR